MKSFVLGGTAALALLATTATSQAQIANCKSIADKMARLACFDRASAEPATPATAATRSALGAQAAYTKAPPLPVVGYRNFVSTEYLYWSYRRGTTPPLATTSAAGGAGLLGGPTTSVLLQDYQPKNASGYRNTLGIAADTRYFPWLAGVETTSFYFAPENRTQSVVGAPGQVIAIPFNNVTPGGGIGTFNGARIAAVAGNNALQLGIPGFFGSVALETKTQLFGGEMNGVLHPRTFGAMTVEPIVGVRFLDLKESLLFRAATTNSVIAPGLAALERAVITDSFKTENMFFGAQIGARSTYKIDRFSLTATAKLALGYNHQIIDVSGSFSDPNPFLGPFFAGPNGFFTGPFNSGRFTRGGFSAVPEVSLVSAYDVTDRIKLSLGYDFLMMTGVARPGNQIDRNINLNQTGLTPFTTGAAPLAGPASPSPVLNGSSTFFAHGLRAGGSYSF